ncbi:hypothetical protein DLAC_10698, partial [Tieghemostelium lacteum]
DNENKKNTLYEFHQEFPNISEKLLSNQQINALVCSCIQNENYEMAANYFEQIPYHQMKSHYKLFDQILYGLARVDQERSLQFLDKLLKYHKYLLTNEIVTEYLRYAGGESIVDRLITVLKRYDVLDSGRLVTLLVDEYMLSRFYETVIRDPLLWVSTTKKLLIDNNDLENGIKCMERMLELGYVPTINIYQNALKLTLEANNLKEFQRLLSKIMKHSLSLGHLYFYNRLALGRYERIHQEITLYLTEKKLTCQPEEIQQVHYYAIMDCLQANQYEQAMKFYMELVNKFNLPPTQEIIRTFSKYHFDRAFMEKKKNKREIVYRMHRRLASWWEYKLLEFGIPYNPEYMDIIDKKLKNVSILNIFKEMINGGAMESLISPSAFSQEFDDKLLEDIKSDQSSPSLPENPEILMEGLTTDNCTVSVALKLSWYKYVAARYFKKNTPQFFYSVNFTPESYHHLVNNLNDIRYLHKQVPQALWIRSPYIYYQILKGLIKLNSSLHLDFLANQKQLAIPVICEKYTDNARYLPLDNYFEANAYDSKIIKYIKKQLQKEHNENPNAPPAKPLTDNTVKLLTEIFNLKINNSTSNN